MKERELRLMRPESYHRLPWLPTIAFTFVLSSLRSVSVPMSEPYMWYQNRTVDMVPESQAEPSYESEKVSPALRGEASV